MDERSGADGGRENGSMISVGRLTSDILERPVSEEIQRICQIQQMESCTHTNYQKVKQVEARCKK